MFYVFGTRSTQIGEAPNQFTCQHCNSKESVSLYIYRRYFHVFWIPAFPLWKSAASQCSHCKQTLRDKEFNAAFKDVSKDAYAKAKTPLWTYSLLLLFSALILVLTISLMSSK